MRSPRMNTEEKVEGKPDKGRVLQSKLKKESKKKRLNNKLGKFC